jgi:hypothetical protein
LGKFAIAGCFLPAILSANDYYRLIIERPLTMIKRKKEMNSYFPTSR